MLRPKVNPLPRADPRTYVVGIDPTDRTGEPFTKEGTLMNILLIIVVVIAIILAITGGLVQSLNFLLWVGLVLLAIAVIAWLIRAIAGRGSGV